MTFEEIYNKFTKSTQENFPVWDCDKQDKNEQNVFCSENPYICLIVDKDFKHSWSIRVLYPYICKEHETRITYGWFDEYGNVFCNIENSTLLRDEFVIGFKEYYEYEDFNKLWDGFIESIEKQWE